MIVNPRLSLCSVIGIVLFFASPSLHKLPGNGVRQPDAVIGLVEPKALFEHGAVESVQTGQAATGTDILMALPGVPGALVRGTVAMGGAYQTGTGIGQITDGNYSDGTLNIGLGTIAIFGSVAGNNIISK